MRISRMLVLVVVLLLYVTSFITKVKAAEIPDISITPQFYNGLPILNLQLPAGQTIDDIDSGSKNDKHVIAQVQLLNGENDEVELSVDDSSAEMKGRGNSTWCCVPKKPYQIKFDTRTSLLGMPEAKKWILDASGFDGSLLRNDLAQQFAGDVGLRKVDAKHVSLFVNGIYRSDYRLSEKIESSPNRIHFDNEGEHGLIVEADQFFCSTPDICGVTTANTKFALHDSQADDYDADNPDSKSKQAFDNFLSTAGKIDNLVKHTSQNWEELNNLLDMQSFADYYFVNEFFQNMDGLRTSFYMYRNGLESDDKIHAGPVWDFDMSLRMHNYPNFFQPLDSDFYRIFCTAGNGGNNCLSWMIPLITSPEFNQLLESRWSVYNSAINHALTSFNALSSALSESGNANYTTWKYLKSSTPEYANLSTHLTLSDYNFKSSWAESVAALKDALTKQAERWQKVVPTKVYKLCGYDNERCVLTTDVSRRLQLLENNYQSKGVLFYSSSSKFQSVLEFYSPNSNEYRYTLDGATAGSYIVLGWKYQGVAFYSSSQTTIPVFSNFKAINGVQCEDYDLVGLRHEFNAQARGNADIPNALTTTPVYRLYNPNSGLHHYTIKSDESVDLVGHGWNLESTEFMVLESGNTPIYRIYNPNDGNHHFTRNYDEAIFLRDLGWSWEGIAWYAVDDISSVPVYRVYNPGNGEHFYAVNFEEVKNAVIHGWSHEGVGWFM